MATPNALAKLITGMQDDITAILAARDYLGDRVRDEFGAVLIERHIAAYIIGKGIDIDALTPADDARIGAIVAREIQYLDGFIAAIDDLSEAQILARGLLYAGSLKQSFSAGETWIWPVPFHPADGGTVCGNNCKCRWKITVLNLEELDADCLWQLGTSEHCSDCLTRAADNPYRVRGGVLLN